MQVYVLSKLLTEETAFKFANENSIDLVSVITTTVSGPFLTPTVPSSIRFLLSPITGDHAFNFSTYIIAAKNLIKFYIKDFGCCIKQIVVFASFLIT